MYVRPTSTRLFSGTLIPEIRAMRALPLPLLVTGVLADDQHRAVAADDLALLAHRLDRRSYLHDPFRVGVQRQRLWLPGRLPLPKTRVRAHEQARGAQAFHDSKGGSVRSVRYGDPAGTR